MFTVVCLVLASCSMGGGETPGELRAALLGRAAFSSARLAYMLEERRIDRPAIERRMEALIVADDIAFTDRGDSDGVRLRQPRTGQPLFGVVGTCRPEYQLLLRDANQMWHRTDGDNFGHLRKGMPPAIRDPRVIGVTPAATGDKSAAEEIKNLESLPLVKWDVQREGSRIVITAWRKLSPEHDYAHEWVLDADKNNAIIEVATIDRRHERRRGVMATHSDYRQVNGRWWPFLVEMKTGRGSYITLKFDSVEFDRKEHPKKLTAEHIGLPIGAYVRVADGTPEIDERYIGENRFVSPEEFEKLRGGLDLSALAEFVERQRQIGPGEYPDWWNDEGGHFGLANAEREPGEWEAYVRRWKIRHGSGSEHPLDAAQQESADAVLKSCLQRAGNIRDKYKNSAEGERREKQFASIFAELKSRLNRLLNSPQEKQEAAAVQAGG